MVWPLALNAAGAPSTVTLATSAAPVWSVTRLNVSALSLPPVVFVTVAVLDTDSVPFDQWTKADAL